MAEVEEKYTNYYVHCGEVWKDTWDSMCNDECPNCGAEIEPFMSEDLEDGEQILHVDSSFVPENGWPGGVKGLADLIQSAEDL